MEKKAALLVKAWYLVTWLVLAQAEREKILSFGGNGMIGSVVMEKLIAEDKYDITLIHRGNWHFDTALTVMPNVNNVVCDRNKDPPCAGEVDCDINTLHYCADVMEVVNKTDKFKAVLDFSGYEPKWVHDAIHALGEKVGVYIYVSSDSVYDVCAAKKKGVVRKTLEVDSVRPIDIAKRKSLIEADRYGDAKLSSEDALKDQREEGGFPWVALRFADVIGPRDTTYRFQLYQLWVTMYHDIGLPVPVPGNIMDTRESLTYVEDAAQSILLAMDKPDSWDESYNIGFEEDFSLWEILNHMANAVGTEGMEQDNAEDEKTTHLYPTVLSGPMDISKAKERLGFKPSNVEKAFKKSAAFYENLFINDEREREEMITRFLTYVLPREAKDPFFLGVGKFLEKHGVIDEKYRKKRKGDLGDTEVHEEL